MGDSVQSDEDRSSQEAEDQSLLAPYDDGLPNSDHEGEEESQLEREEQNDRRKRARRGDDLVEEAEDRAEREATPPPVRFVRPRLMPRESISPAGSQPQQVPSRRNIVCCVCNSLPCKPILRLFPICDGCFKKISPASPATPDKDYQ